MAISIPFLGRRSSGEDKPAKQKAASGAPRPLPIIGRLSTGKQLQILTGLLVLFLAADAVIVALDTRKGTFDTQWIASVGKIQMLSQRLAKAAQQASQGNREAFKQLRDSRPAPNAKIQIAGDAPANAPRSVK